MATWYAHVAITDLPGYSAGAVVSYGTVQLATDDLERQGLEEVDLGEHGSGIDFNVLEWHPQSRRLRARVVVPRDPLSDEALADSLEEAASALRSGADAETVADAAEAVAGSLRTRPPRVEAARVR